MKICHVTSSLTDSGAGVAKVVLDLANFQRRVDHDVAIVTLVEEGRPDQVALRPDIRVLRCPVRLSRSFGFSFSLRDATAEGVGSADVAHLHGLWMYPSWAARNAARRQKTRYILSPHGMLEPWALGSSRWKKRAASFLFEARNIRSAACLHACSETEARSIRRSGYTGPIGVVPPGLSLRDLELASGTCGEATTRRTWDELGRDKKVLLFLSRLHRVKGLELLLNALALVRSRLSDWHVVVAGPGEERYVESLRTMANRLGLDGAVSFIGAVPPEDKWALYRRAHLFVLPTLSENFGWVVPEALACGVPVITTTGAPWSELKAHRCGWWVEARIGPLRDCLSEALELGSEALQAMGRRGRELVEASYTLERFGRGMDELYRWAAGGGTAPESVRLPLKDDR